MQFLFQLPNFYASWFGIVATLLVTSTKLLMMRQIYMSAWANYLGVSVTTGNGFGHPGKKSSKPMFCITGPVTRNAGIVI